MTGSENQGRNAGWRPGFARSSLATGDVKPVGDGVMEMREHFGPGWRMYYIQREATVIMMLGGGDKDSQARDIAAAKRLAEALED